MQNRYQVLLLWSVFLFGFYYYCLRVTGLDLSYTPGDFGDSRFINYILEHGYRWLIGKETKFWTANFMYPLEYNVAISDCLAGVLPIYAFFRFIGMDTERAYQFWWLTCSVLNYFCAYYAFRRLRLSALAAIIGSYIFAFGINNLNQFMHLQMNCKFFFPLVIAFVFQFLEKKQIKYYVFACFMFILLFYTNAYLAIFTLLFLIFFVPLYWLSLKPRFALPSGKTWLAVFVFILTSLISAYCLWKVARPYYQMALSLGKIPYLHIAPGLPRIWSYFLPHENVLLYDFLKDSPLKSEPNWYLHDLFPGLFVYSGLILSAGYFIYWLIRSRKGLPLPFLLVSICIIIVYLITRDRHMHSAFEQIRILPGFQTMRLAGRAMSILVFVMLWTSLWYLDKLPKVSLNRYLPFILVFVLLENLFVIKVNTLRTSSSDRRFRTEKMAMLIQLSNSKHKRIIAVINTSKRDESFQTDVMLASQKLDLYTFNGYSSNCFGELCYAYTDPEHKQLKAWMRRNHISENEVTFIHY
ncbi:MAG TPA: hypothetical protein PLQ93_13555 [Bacteroidia bacterium]|nr:hypothetical protein [Bacteroidia bacterium]